MKIALIHDHFAQEGGAEKVIRAFQTIFPESPTYTLVYNPDRSPEFNRPPIITSFLQKIPFGVRTLEWFLFLMPSATENHNLNNYDLIISSTSFSAKGVITAPSATHICYCHTPTRFLWTGSHEYLQEMGHNYLIRKILPLLLPRLRIWDRLAAERVDYFIANSVEVKKRIKKYYHRDSDVIYPPVATKNFQISKTPEKYFLAGGRLVGYKKFDLIIQAFNRLNIPLKIFGTGPLLSTLKKQAHENIEFLGRVSEATKTKLFANCQAFLNPQIEDFGITAVEAMASGRPVIAYYAGGAKETVIEGKTGTFFHEQTWENIVDKILRFRPQDFNPQEIRDHALQFDEEIFKKKIKNLIADKLGYRG
jgi:glycosyltransferase involved in cell wall biosynthesis